MLKAPFGINELNKELSPGDSGNDYIDMEKQPTDLMKEGGH